MAQYQCVNNAHYKTACGSTTLSTNISCHTPATEVICFSCKHCLSYKMLFTRINCTSYLCVMKYIRYNIVRVYDAEVRTHIRAIYILINNNFIEVSGHKFYLSMECVNLCVIPYMHNRQKITI
jgi:hypothetical protein